MDKNMIQKYLMSNDEELNMLGLSIVIENLPSQEWKEILPWVDGQSPVDLALIVDSNYIILKYRDHCYKMFSCKPDDITFYRNCFPNITKLYESGRKG